VSLSQAQELKERTKQFACRQVVSLVAEDGGSESHRQAGTPLEHLGGGELPCRLQGTFKAEFVAKIGVVVEEADEAVFWLELLVEQRLFHRPG
jgi:hypothetical protein